MGNRYDEPEYEVVGLTFRQKLTLEWIIFKTWVKRVFSHEASNP